MVYSYPSQKIYFVAFIFYGGDIIPCYHPLIAEVDYERDVFDKAKKKLHFVSYPISLDDAFSSSNHLLIPCGQCMGCRLEYSRQWANRMMMELDSHEDAWFVTLTYNDEHLPLSANPATGEVVATLRKRDVQLFMKRLRKHRPGVKIRYFCSGEYGDKGKRPHYHLIIYGLKLDDLVYYKHSEEIKGKYFNYYLSPFLEKIWSDENGQIGWVVVAEVAWETCAYTARYVMKKLKGEQADVYSTLGIEPPFALMSRKPGLGSQYYHDHPDMYNSPLVSMPTVRGGIQFAPPKYIDSLFAEEFPVTFDEIQEIRTTAAKEKVKAKLRQTSLSYSEMLAVEERNLKDKIKILRRNVE